MVEVKVSTDGMTAEVALHPEEGELLTPELVEDMLRLEGVQIGIDKAAIAEMLAKEIYGQFMTVAKGKPPVDGLDGYYEYFFEMVGVDGKPMIRDDGSVDYTFKVINVDKGDLLAEYHPETAGTFGYNVFSKVLSPKRGKPQRPLRCLDVQLEENKYYAGINGHVMLSDDTLSIQNVLEIKGDTAYSDGDIDFNGDIHVSGNICNGIKVHAAGSVIVDGVIESANVYAGLDIIVSQGIHGQGTDNPDQVAASTVVEAKGQLKSKFIDHAFVKTGGDIFIDYAVGSVIISEGRVTALGSKGAIIGGNVTALLGVDAGVIGNTAEILTEITIGEEKGFSEKFSQGREKLLALEEKLSEYQGQKLPEELQELSDQTRKEYEDLEKSTGIAGSRRLSSAGGSFQM